MSKKWIVVAGLLVVVGALALAGITYAQTSTPPGMPGYGMMGSYGYGRGMMNNQAGVPGLMHDGMFNAIAEGLGLTREELDSRIAAGETPYQIAQAQGLTQQEFAQLMVEARQAAIDQATADGLLTQEQADWMLNHMGGRAGRFGSGAGGCPMLNQGADA